MFYQAFSRMIVPFGLLPIELNEPGNDDFTASLNPTVRYDQTDIRVARSSALKETATCTGGGVKSRSSMSPMTRGSAHRSALQHVSCI